MYAPACTGALALTCKSDGIFETTSIILSICSVSNPAVEIVPLMIISAFSKSLTLLTLSSAFSITGITSFPKIPSVFKFKSMYTIGSICVFAPTYTDIYPTSGVTDIGVVISEPVYSALLLPTDTLGLHLVIWTVDDSNLAGR